MKRLYLVVAVTCVVGWVCNLHKLHGRAPDDPEIAILIQDLGSDDFAVREAATKRLREMGKAAKRPLREALHSKDLEVRARAERLLTDLAFACSADDLIEDLASKLPEIRLKAMETIATKKLKNEDIVRQLQAMLREQDEKLRDDAAVTLLLLGEENVDNELVKKASCDKKYSKLLRRIEVPQDRQSYGEFQEYGHYAGNSHGGYNDLPAGYWVWVAPHWYIWGTSKDKAQAGNNKQPVAPAPVIINCDRGGGVRDKGK